MKDLIDKKYVKSGMACLLSLLLACISGMVLAQQQPPVLSLSPLSSAGQPVAVRMEPNIELSTDSSISVAHTRFIVEFVSGSEDVAGINFDVVVDADSDSLELISCAAGVGKSHIAQCQKVAPNRVRVLIFSAPVAKLQAVEALRFEIAEGALNPRIDEDSVAVSDLSGTVIRAEVI